MTYLSRIIPHSEFFPEQQLSLRPPVSRVRNALQRTTFVSFSVPFYPSSKRVYIEFLLSGIECE